MSVYYNDNDSYCCRVLRARIADGSLPKGFVDERDISEIDPTEIGEFNQWHLFAGIGGFPLGLVWAGLPPDTRILTGGFPCQDISTAGKGAGIRAERSGLWSQMLRFIGVLRPDVVFVENVAALLVRGIGTVLGEMAEVGYDCKWHCVPAAYVGAPHRRDRIWIVGVRDVADAPIVEGDGREFGHGKKESRQEGILGGKARGESSNVADAEGQGLEGEVAARNPCADGCAAEYGQGGRSSDCWAVEPAVCQLVDGLSGGLVRYYGRTTTMKVPDRVAKLKALGNAVVPQVVQFVAQLLIEECRGAKIDQK